MLSKKKWSGPNDKWCTTKEYIDEYNRIMNICRASPSLRVELLSQAFVGEALDEYASYILGSEQYGTETDASILIRAVGERLETPEFKALKRNEWTELRIADFKKKGKSMQDAFGDLKRYARKLQSMLGGHYEVDGALCDFYRRSCQDAEFFTYVQDYGTDINSKTLSGMIANAITKQDRLDAKRSGAIASHATDMTNNRFAVPKQKQKNRRDRYGKTTKCNGCGSEYHYYRDCKDPNKKTYSENRLSNIAALKSVKDRKVALQSYHMQIDEHNNGTESEEEEESEPEEDFKGIADELLETNFLETDFIEEDNKDDYHGEVYISECLMNSTRHSFFLDQHTRFTKPRSVKVHPKVKLRYPPNRFFGVMVDNGSTGSLCSVSQLEAYRTFTGNPAPMRKLRNHRCVSAHGGSNCIGIATFRFPYDDTVIEFDAPIVENSDSPLILGLSDQDRLQSPGVNQRSNTMTFGTGPEIPIIRELGHLWIQWSYRTECLFTEKELTKLHYRFGHPGTERMYNFLKRVKPSEVNKETRAMLKDISSRCKECQYLAPKPYVVKVAVPRDDLMFNSEVILDIMYIQGRPVLHCVDKATHYQAAKFIDDISTETIWRTFMEMWSLVYLGPPDNLRHDQGTQFVMGGFQEMAAEAGITCRPVGFESANAMGVGERYHGPLRKTFLKLQGTYGTEYKPEPLPSTIGRTPAKQKKKKTETAPVDDKYILAISVMCINATVGPEGICPTLLVFGAMPKLPLPATAPAAVPHGERMMMITTAREEYLKIVGNIRLKTAEKAFIPKTLPLSVETGDKVLVYREKSGKWEPRFFVSRDENVIYIREPDGTVQPYGKTKVSDYNEGTYLPRPDLYGLVQGNNGTDKNAITTTVPKDTPSKDTDESDGFGSKEIDDIFFPETESMYTVVVKSNEKRISEFQEAIKTELDGLKKKGVFHEVNRSSLPPNANVIKAKLILSVKEPGEPEERKKARIVAQAVGSLDTDKDMLMTYSPTVGKNSIRLMLAISLGTDLSLFTRDISQAYVSTGTDLLRKVYLIPPKELQMNPDIVWEVQKPLYGLPESGVHWFECYVGHHEGKLGMIRTEVDPCLLYKKDKDRLVSLCCLQVDDTLVAGTEKFVSEENEACRIFESKGQTRIENGVSTKFNGMQMTRREDCIFLNQNTYIDRLPTGKIPRVPRKYKFSQTHHLRPIRI